MRRRLKGSMTVEASLVMPVVLLCVISVAMMAMDLRDRVYISAWLGAEAQLAAEQGYLVGEPELLVSTGSVQAVERSKSRIVLTYSGSGSAVWPGGSVSYEDTAVDRIPDQPSLMYICRMLETVIRS